MEVFTTEMLGVGEQQESVNEAARLLSEMEEEEQMEEELPCVESTAKDFGGKQGIALQEGRGKSKSRASGEEGRELEGVKMEPKLCGEKRKETDLEKQKKIRSGKLKRKKTRVGEKRREKETEEGEAGKIGWGISKDECEQ